MGRRMADLFLKKGDGIRLDALRVLLGISMIAYFGYLTAGWRYAGEWLTDEGFHVTTRIMKNLPIAPLLKTEWLPGFGIVFFGVLVLWTLGVRLRVTGWAVFLLVSYVSAADPLSSYTVNRMFILCTWVLACAPLGAYWSLDGRKERPDVMQSVWPIRILQLVLVTHYFLAGWAKAYYGDWLKDPYLLLQQSQHMYMNEPCVIALRLLPKSAWVFMQYSALVFELTAPVTFCVKRLRPLGLIWGASFQILVALLMHDLIYFSLQMLSLYVLFVNDAQLHSVHRFLQRMVRECVSRCVRPAIRV